VAAQALETGQAETIGILVIVGLVVVGAIISAIITAIIGRIIVIVLVLVLAGYIWTQRSDISSAAKKCDATFLGIHLTPSDATLRQHCQDISR
jgi:uncharacterized membrane protein